MVNVARIPCKCDAVHAANNPREMHIFMLSFICKKQIHLFKTVLGRCVPNWIFLYKIVLSEMRVFTRKRYPRPITVLHTNNELLTFSEKLRIDEEDAVLWLTHASFFKRRFKKTNTQKKPKKLSMLPARAKQRCKSLSSCVAMCNRHTSPKCANQTEQS